MTCPIDEVPVISIKRMMSMSYSGHVLLREVEGEGFFKKLAEWSEYNAAWQDVTDHFTYSVIEKYVKLYNEPDDQLQLLNCIRTSFAIEDAALKDWFMDKMEKKIKAGRKKTGKTASSKVTATYQTFIMPNVTQFNNNPQTVINQTKEE